MSDSIDPLRLLQLDRRKARARRDSAADLCTVGTVDQDGNPSLRTLVLRHVNDKLAIFVNGTSPKVKELSNSDSVAAMIYLPSVSVQYRLTCTVTAIDPRVVHEFWLLRPEISKKLDALYESNSQGSEIPSQAWLEEQIASTAAPSEATASAIGFYLQPQIVARLELDDRPDFVHRATRYVLDDAGEWTVRTLMP